MKLVPMIVLLLVAVSPTASGQKKKNEIYTDRRAEQEVRTAHSERLQALINRDLGTLEKLLADDLIYISPTGRAQTKAEILSDLKSGALKVSSIEPSDMMVRLYGKAAVITYITKSSFFDSGGNHNDQIRSTNVYVKVQGRWQLVSQQMTRITSP